MNDKPTACMQAVMDCVAWLIENKAVDPDRVYACGASMGSMGMWDLVCRRPEWFAAGISCCGGFDADQAEKVAHIPFRIFHGGADNIVPKEGSIAMFEALKEAGAENVDYTEYPGGSHFAWGPTYGNKDNLEWLFKQRRIQPRDAVRTWTSSTGRKMEAKFVQCVVILETPEGKRREIDLESFSEDDRRYIDALLK
jgi:predicted peptidase